MNVFSIRTVVKSDIDFIMQIEEKAFSNSIREERKIFLNRINIFAEGFFAHGEVFVSFRVGEWRPDYDILTAVCVLCHGDYVNQFSVIPLVVPGVNSPVRHPIASVQFLLLSI